MRKTRHHIHIISLIFCLFALAPLYSQSESKTVQVVTPNLENIPSSYHSWLPGQIRDSLRGNLRDYTDYTITIDDSNERQLKKLQEKSESAAYDSSVRIEAGKITKAQYALFSTIRKAGSQYIINITFLNLTTGINDAVANSTGKKDAEDLFSGAGSAVDELTLKLCEQLNINLTATQKFVLKNGTSDLSTEQQLVLEQQARENYQKRVAELQSQISSTVGSTDLAVVAKRQELEAQRDLEEEKLKTTLRRQEELQKKLEQEQQDKIKENQRTSKWQEQRNALEKEVEEAAAKARKENLDNQSVVGQINLIESKKKSLVAIRESVKTRKQELSAEANEEVLEYEAKLNSEPLRTGETEAIAKMRRQEKIDDLKKELQKRVEKDQKAVDETVAKQDAELLADIRKSQMELNKKRTVSSFGDELVVSYMDYYAESFAWGFTMSLYADGVLLDEDVFSVSYTTLTGKDVPDLAKASDEVYYDYLDTIETYSSLFMRGSPILNFELDYKVEALPDDRPSAYKFSFLELRIKDTKKNKVIQKKVLPVDSLERNWVPAYDIRTTKEREDYSLKTKEQIYREQHFDQSKGGGGFAGQRIGAGYTSNKTFCVDLNYSFADIGFPYLFIIFDAGFIGMQETYKTISNKETEFYASIGWGLNKRIMIGKYPPTVYAWAGVGGLSFQLTECYGLNKEKDSDVYKTGYNEAFLLGRFAAGIEIPFSKMFAVYIQGVMSRPYHQKPYYEAVGGLSLTFN